jgi:Ca-activated chloride channel family protein
MDQNNHKYRALCILIFCIPCFTAAEGLTEAASLSTRNRYQANRGIIVPSVEIQNDSYITSFNYHYPEPETDIGFYLYNHLNRETATGRDGMLQIGIQSRILPFAKFPPLNLAFVVDTSRSMDDDEKISWVQESLGSFVTRIRAVDSLALISFNDTARPLFESTRMDSPEKRGKFLDAVNELSAEGGTRLEDGINLGYEQVMMNYQPEAVNLVLLISDGNEFSGRLSQALAHSGDIRISLIWNNRNDLDLHVITPAGEEIFFANMRDSTGGWLDVDRNVNGETTEPVENIFWYQDEAAHGQYHVWVRNYAYHDSEYTTPFQVEVKNGTDFRYFEGSISGTGRNSDTLVWTFDFDDSVSLSPVYHVVEIHTEDGVSISTMGIGGNFDEELLQTLAEYGRGASRSVQDREVMMQILNTDQEFERFAVPAARDIQMEVEFTPGIEVLGAWGIQYKIENNRVISRLPNLHQGDYKTLLIHYRIPPQNRERLTAVFRVTETDSPTAPEQVIVLTDPPDEDASRTVIRSQAMVHFAEAMREIGDIYYAGGDNTDRFRTALQRTGEAQQELENTRQQLGDASAFTPELAVLSRYSELLTGELNKTAAERRSRMSAEGGRFSRMTAEP